MPYSTSSAVACAIAIALMPTVSHGGPPVSAPDIRAVRSAPVPRPFLDSLSVLLARLDGPRDVVISSRGTLRSLPAAVGNRDRSLALRAHGDRVEILSPEAGTRFVESIRIEATDALTLRSGTRSARIPGSLIVSASNNRLRPVARISVEAYLVGVLAAESAPDDPTEYLVALSVLQRNYIAAHSARHGDADVCDNTHCQLLDLAALARPREGAARLHAIVARASTIDLGADDHPSYYSACCGGGTLTPADVWGRVESGYARVACTTCGGSRWHRWTSVVPRGAAADAVLRTAPAAPFVDDDFKIRAGRALGWRVVPSNTIDAIERRGTRWVLRGRGFGHRVGLCQAGARELARRSRRADEILQFYFPQSRLTIR